MQTSALQHFEWDSLAASDQQWLKDRTAAIKFSLRETVTNLLLIGTQLNMVRERVGKKAFRGWLASELSLERRTARRLMTMAAMFSHIEEEALKRIDRSALYALCEPHVPASAREYAVELARDGKKLTHAEARAIVDAYKPPPPEKLPKLTRAEAREESKVFQPVADNRLRESLQKLLSSGGILHISAMTDDEDGSPVVYARYHPESGTPVQVSRSTPEDAVLALAGNEPEQVCRGCDKSKPMNQFSYDSTQPLGRNRRCRDCERIRLNGVRRGPASPGQQQ